jgi:hypothetical protein
MNLRYGVLLAGAVLISSALAHADDTVTQRVKQAFRGKVETRFIVAEIVRIGKPATPVVLDMLWGRGAFNKEPRPHVALETLAKLRDQSALPELRDYLASPNDYRRVPTLEAMLAIRHDAAAQDEAVALLNGWIKQGLPLDGLRGMLLGLPANGWTEREATAFAGRLALDAPSVRDGLFYQFAESTSPLADAILTDFARRSPDNRKAAVAGIAEAGRELQESLARWEKDTSPPATSQKAWLPGEWREHRKGYIAALKGMLARHERLKLAL